MTYDLISPKSLNAVNGMTYDLKTISYRLQAMSYEVPERSEWDDLISTKSLNEVNGMSYELRSP